LTLVVGENSSVKHAFSVSTTATRTTRRIALPQLRPSLSVPRSLSLSLAENFPCPVFPFTLVLPVREFHLPAVTCFPLASVLPVGENFPCRVFPSSLSSARGRKFSLSRVSL
jgi:hypothetical protein